MSLTASLMLSSLMIISSTIGQSPPPIHVHSIVGVGFGPSNVALAIAAQAAGVDDIVFLEKKATFAWHPGMLLDTSQLQVVFLKDLITLVDPSSRFTFLNYLKEHGRLNEFINLRQLFPSRIEFADYYAWAARQFASSTLYSCEVTRIEKAPEGIDAYAVHYADRGVPKTIYAKNVVLADGNRPFVPAGVQLSRRVIHSQDTLFKLDADYPDYRSNARVAVVGSGQTAVDVLTYLRARYPNMRVTAFIRGFAFKPQDDSQFVNELFFPAAVDMWYSMKDESMKAALQRRHADVTHSSADTNMLPSLYNSYYSDKATGANRFAIVRFHELLESTTSDESVDLCFKDHLLREEQTYEFDLVILATGYRRAERVAQLEGVEGEFRKDARGAYALTRNYAIDAVGEGSRRVYLQGYGERSHGFSEALLSLMPIRAKEIVGDIQLRASSDSGHSQAVTSRDVEELQCANCMPNVTVSNFHAWGSAKVTLDRVR